MAYIRRVTMHDQHIPPDPSQRDIDKAVAYLPEDWNDDDTTSNSDDNRDGGMRAIRPPCLLQRHAFDDEAGPSTVPKRRKPKGKGRKKPAGKRPESSPEDTDDGSMDQYVQPPQPVPPFRTTWPHAQPDPINEAPEENDSELPNELM